MPITNINTFQQGIDNSKYLTTYTDIYLKQALANLGQRFSTKGDGISTSSFKIAELFPDYLGNIAVPGLCVNFTINANSNNGLDMTGEILKFVENPKTGTWKFEKDDSDGNSDQHSSFILENLNYNSIDNLYDDPNYRENGIILTEGQINDTDKWASKDTIILKKSSGTYLYKTRAVKLNKTKELIFEEISSRTNKIIDALRIFILDDSDDKSPVYMFYMYEDRWQYYLDIYKVDMTDATIFGDGSLDERLDVLYGLLVGTIESDYILNPYSDIRYIKDELLIDSSNNILSFEGKYEIDYNTSKNQYFSFIKHQDFSNTTLSKEDAENRLEYFTDDLCQLYPVIKETYHEIKYGTSLKLFREIVGRFLVTEVYQDLKNEYSKYDETGQSLSTFTVTFPIDYEFTYNVNSNNGAIIYNSVNNISAHYINNYFTEYTSFKDNNVIDAIKEVSNNNFDSEGTIHNENVCVIHGYETKSILYQFTITYVDETIIDQILWSRTFSLPYVNDNGYWVIDGTVTDIYAFGKDAQKTNFVVIQSELNNIASVYTTHDPNAFVKGTLLSDPYYIKDIVPMDSNTPEYSYWGPRTVYVPYLAGVDTDRIDTNTYYALQAYLPTDEYINEISSTNEFSYLKNSIFVNLVSPSTEKDIWFRADTTYYETDGYEREEDPDTDRSYWVLYQPKGGSLASKIGPRGVITTFWAIKYDDTTSKYTFDYLRREGADHNLALDITYMCNLEQQVKYHMSTSIEPDNFEHSWVVFDGVNKQYKNNTNTGERDTVYPVIINREGEYYSKTFGNFSDLPTEDSTVSDIFTNQLNLNIAFQNNIVKDDYGAITYVGQKEGSAKYWTLDCQDNSYYVPKNPDEYFANLDKGKPTPAALEKIGHSTYTILNTINYSRFQKEFIPNSAPTENGLTQMFPMVDLSEVLLRDQNTLNRINILTVGKTNSLTDKSTVLYPLYYAYLGSSYESDDKSIIHLGTSSTNPNIGTKTQTDIESTESFNKASELDIDIDKVQLNGDTSFSKKAIFNEVPWTRQDIELGPDADPLTIYSTIITPTDILHTEKITSDKFSYINLSPDNNYQGTNIASYSNDPNSSYQQSYTYTSKQRIYQHLNNCEDHLLSSLTIELPKSDTRMLRSTRYFSDDKVDKDTIKVSYLNLSKLIDRQGFFQNSYFYVSGDAQLTYHTYAPVEKHQPEQLSYKTSYFLELTTDLEDHENLLIETPDGKKIVTSNPIQISYTRTKMPAMSQEDVNVSYVSYLYPTSYTEHWTCPGCSLCTSYTCDLIKFCSHSKVEGWVTYEYGTIEKEFSYRVKPVTFNLERYVTEPTITGGTITKPVTVQLQYPNPRTIWMNSKKYDEETKRWSYTNSQGYYVDNLIDEPKDDLCYTYMMVGTINFEPDVESTYKSLVKLGNRIDGKPVTYKIEEGIDGNYSYRKISYSYIENETHYINYEFDIPEKASYTGPDGQPAYIAYMADVAIINADGKYERIVAYSYITKQTTIDKKYSFIEPHGQVFIPTYIDAIHVNVRELTSTHSIPHSMNGVASLNGPMGNMKGTNKYK